MANHASHGALPYPIKGARFSVLIPYLDADGDPTDPTSPDTEVSKDDGAPADAAEETGTYRNSVGLLTLTGAETDCSTLSVAAKGTGIKTTILTLFPRVLASVGTGTLSAGSAGGGTLGTVLAYDVTGCFIKTTGGTGGGGTGGANNQVRKIITYNTSTGAFTVAPNWETTPDNTTTYDVLLPEGVTLGMLKALNPSTPGRTLGVESDGDLTKVNELHGHTAQTGDSYAIVNSGTHGNAALKTLIDTIDTIVDAILDDTGTSGVAIADGTLTAAKFAAACFTAAKFAAGALDAAALATDAAQEIRDSVWAKTLTELTGDPGATAAVLDALCLLFMAVRNKRTTDSGAGEDKIYNNAGTAILTATITDAANVLTKNKYA